MVRIVLDWNNMYIINRLLYYVVSNKHTTDVSTYILESRVTVKNAEDFLFIPTEPITFDFESHPITLTYYKTRSSTNYQHREVRFEQLILETSKGFDHLRKFLVTIDRVIIPDSDDDELSKYIWTSDMWRYNKPLKARSLETIYFHDKERIVNTIDKFLNDTHTAEKYEKLSIPYKKIIMFHGLPGSGKTSFIKALATHFKYNLSFVKNIPKLDDISLEEMMNSMRQKTFLVFEDVDTFVQQRETRNSNVSFGGLLNVLDGITNVNKLVIFITTNHIHSLDMAFKRRIDIFIEFGHIKRTETIEMYQKFFDASLENASMFYEAIKFKKCTVNALEKFFINCMNNNVHPIKNLDFLDDYNQMTSDSKIVEQLYS